FPAQTFPKNVSTRMNSRSLLERICQPERESRPAILFEQRAITYSELRGEVLRAAESLNASGVVAGDRVAILLADSPEFVASFIAVISLGAIAVPVNLALKREDQLFILKDGAARVAIDEAKVAGARYRDYGGLLHLEDRLNGCRDEECQ